MQKILFLFSFVLSLFLLAACCTTEVPTNLRSGALDVAQDIGSVGSALKSATDENRGLANAIDEAKDTNSKLTDVITQTADTNSELENTLSELNDTTESGAGLASEIRGIVQEIRERNYVDYSESEGRDTTAPE